MAIIHIYVYVLMERSTSGKVRRMPSEFCDVYNAALVGAPAA
jgi:hypothetical protein